MKLSPEQVALFYKLMWPLQFYINQKLHLLSGVDSVETYTHKYSFEDKLPVRNALYDNWKLVEGFIKENPAKLSRQELAIVQSWQNFVLGDFYIERFLKSGAIFIGPHERVYLVQGLTNSIEEVMGFRPLPIMTKTVLLPFQGRIIYDGLFQFYSVFFGGGIKRNIKEIYLTAKQNRRIIESLDPVQQARQQEQSRSRPGRDWRPEVDELVKAAGKLKAGQVPIQKEAFSLLKASVELAQAVTHQPDDLDALWKATNRVGRALNRLEATLDRAER